MKTVQERPELSTTVSSPRIHHLKSLEKGLALLEAFGPEAPALTMTELAHRCIFTPLGVREPLSPDHMQKEVVSGKNMNRQQNMLRNSASRLIEI